MGPRIAIVIRRALGTARDASSVRSLLAGAGVAAGPELAAALASDAWGLALVAERSSRPVGVLVLRLLRAPGAAPGDPVETALVDALHVAPDARRQGVGRALLDAARAEAEARDARRFLVIAEARDEVARAFLAATDGSRSPEAPPEPPPPLTAPPAAANDDAAPPRVDATFELAPGARVHLDGSARAPETSTLWSGALAFRVRWRGDRASPGWSAEGCVGSAGDEGDALRFDRATRRLREAYLTRPSAVRFDDALLALAASAPAEGGVLRLADDAADFALAPMDDALFDLSLAVFVALRREAADALAARGSAEGLRAVAVSPHVALLFEGGRYAGWRVADPLAHARPMGWPELREPEAPDDPRREALRALVYDWMVIDASPRVSPSDAASPEEVEHMVALRERARALADLPGDERDPTSGVARDVAAHIHWGWGFYRVGE